MDLYCKRCTEPVDNDYFHDYADEIGSTYRAVARDFQARGCEAVGFGKCEDTHSFKGMAMDAMFDLLGDDMDSAASMMDDFEYLGLL